MTAPTARDFAITSLASQTIRHGVPKDMSWMMLLPVDNNRTPTSAYLDFYHHL
jgi:hypothetical protein